MFEVRAGAEAPTSPRLVFMKKSMEVHRPATGKHPLTNARFPQELVDRIERLAKPNEITRSEALRRLVEHALPS
jgi:hypothetical protein